MNAPTNEEGSELNHLAFGCFTFGPNEHDHEAQAVRDILKVNFSMLFCSMNPLIDIGQIEGGFVMGLGCHLMEDIIYDINTGRVLNDGTWVSALCLLPLDSLREHLFWHWIIIWWKTSVTPTLAGSLTMERGYMCTFLLPQSGLLHHVEDYVYCPWIV